MSVDVNLKASSSLEVRKDSDAGLSITTGESLQAGISLLQIIPSIPIGFGPVPPILPVPVHIVLPVRRFLSVESGLASP
jgi:hypothetical protein